MIEFYDQAWKVFSTDAENDGVISQYVIYIIEKYRKDDSIQRDLGEKKSQIGDMVVRWEIASDRIIVKSIVNAEDIIAEHAARADREKYLAVLKRVPDAYPVGGDEIVEKVTRDNR